VENYGKFREIKLFFAKKPFLQNNETPENEINNAQIYPGRYRRKIIDSGFEMLYSYFIVSWMGRFFTHTPAAAADPMREAKRRQTVG
jgi:hypothetical protein